MGFIQEGGGWIATCDEPTDTTNKIAISGFDVETIIEHGITPPDFAPTGWAVAKLARDLPLLEGYVEGTAVIACPLHRFWLDEVSK